MRTYSKQSLNSWLSLIWREFGRTSSSVLKYFDRLGDCWKIYNVNICILDFLIVILNYNFLKIHNCTSYVCFTLRKLMIFLIEQKTLIHINVVYVCKPYQCLPLTCNGNYYRKHCYFIKLSSPTWTWRLHFSTNHNWY